MKAPGHEVRREQRLHADAELASALAEAREYFALSKVVRERTPEQPAPPAGVVTTKQIEDWFAARGVAVRVTMGGGGLFVERVFSHYNGRPIIAGQAAEIELSHKVGVQLVKVDA